MAITVDRSASVRAVFAAPDAGRMTKYSVVWVDAYSTLATKRCGEMPYMARRIFVTSTLARDEASWVIRDEGPGFDPATLPDPTAPEYLERPHGRGLMLMRTFMSEVHYNSQGNEVRMVKRRA